MESPHKTLPTCQLLPTLKLSSPSLSRPFTESMSATMSTFIGCPVFSLSCFKPNGFLSRRFDKANFGSLLIKSYVNIMGPIMCGKFFVAIFCQNTKCEPDTEGICICIWNLLHLVEIGHQDRHHMLLRFGIEGLQNIGMYHMCKISAQLWYHNPHHCRPLSF